MSSSIESGAVTSREIKINFGLITCWSPESWEKERNRHKLPVVMRLTFDCFRCLSCHSTTISSIFSLEIQTEAVAKPFIMSAIFQVKSEKEICIKNFFMTTFGEWSDEKKKEEQPTKSHPNGMKGKNNDFSCLFISRILFYTFLNIFVQLEQSGNSSNVFKWSDDDAFHRFVRLSNFACRIRETRETSSVMIDDIFGEIFFDSSSCSCRTCLWSRPSLWQT